MKCPRCAIDLNKANLASIELDYCSSCRGVWFDATELERVFKTYGSELPKSELVSDSPELLRRDEVEGQKELPCPRCNAIMLRKRYDQNCEILIDSCESGCGIWFDEGELTAVLEHIDTEKFLENRTQISDAINESIRLQTEGESKSKQIVDNMFSDKMETRNTLSRLLGSALHKVYQHLHKRGL